MTTLLLGATGRTGIHIAARLHQAGHALRGVDARLGAAGNQARVDNRILLFGVFRCFGRLRRRVLARISIHVHLARRHRNTRA